jgi:phosphatidylglycerol---prolipoprotein diacylglyceryl transferase
MVDDVNTPEPTRSSRWLGRRYLHVGRHRVPTYTALLYVGFAVGVACGAYETGLDYLRFTVAAIILLAFALIGARIWYLIGHPEVLADPTLGAKKAGGLYGAFLLSVAVSWPVLRLMGLEFWRSLDGGAIAALVALVFVRIGCLINSCCYGRETHGPFGLWLPDPHGQWKRRYPTQLFEAGWAAIILGIGVSLYRPSNTPGLLFFGAAAAFAIGRPGLRLLRADAAITSRLTRMNLAFSAMLAVVSIAGFVLKLR